MTLGNFSLFLIGIIVLAAIFRDNLLFTLFYLLAGGFIVSRIWSRRAIQALQYVRDFPSHAFFGERIAVKLTLRNPGRLPLVWVQMTESLPLELSFGLAEWDQGDDPQALTERAMLIGEGASADHRSASKIYVANPQVSL